MTMNVLRDMQDPILGIVTWDFMTLWDLHVHRSCSRSLWMSLHTINLFGMPSVEENHAKGKVDSWPRGSGRVGEITTVNSFSHVVTTNV